ncbi:MAG: sulfatase-like hydrolase/transferase, partial [Cupriavidus necator]
WDETRKQRHARQVSSGLIPSDWPLSGRSPNIPAWDELDADTQTLYAHYMEVYAAMVDNIDQNIGRLVEFLRQSESLENTIVVITSDNGASSIGGPQGAANIFEKRVSGAEPEGLAAQMMHAGKLGGLESYAAYPVGWGNASNTPFRFYKRTPMNGGIRVPYIMHWPRGIEDGGAVRNQWIHVTDTLPTLMEIAGIRYPNSFRGQRTRGLNGLSFRELLSDPAKPSRRTRQHYELEGNRGYIRGQWKIVSLQPPGTRIDLDNWMLFDLANDPTECQDIAAARPDLVAELIAEFEADAEANYVYPLDNRDNRRVLAVPPFLEQEYARPRTFYSGTPTVPTAVVSPLIADRDYVLECEFEYEEGKEGVLFAFGNVFGGLTVFVERGCLHLVYNGGQRQAELASTGLLNGRNRIVLTHKATGSRVGLGTVSRNGQDLEQALDMTPTILRLTGEGLDVGCDRRLKVSRRYRERGTFPYAGCIHWVRLSPGVQAPDSLANRPERLAQLD